MWAFRACAPSRAMAFVPPPACGGLCRLKPAFPAPCAMQALGLAGAALSQHLAALAQAVQLAFANRKPKTAMRTVTSRPRAPNTSRIWAASTASLRSCSFSRPSIPSNRWSIPSNRRSIPSNRRSIWSKPAAHLPHERLKLLGYGFRHHGVQPLFRSIGDHGFGAGVQKGTEEGALLRRFRADSVGTGWRTVRRRRSGLRRWFLGGRLLAVGGARHQGILRGVRVREDRMSSLLSLDVIRARFFPLRTGMWKSRSERA